MIRVMLVALFMTASTAAYGQGLDVDEIVKNLCTKLPAEDREKIRKDIERFNLLAKASAENFKKAVEANERLRDEIDKKREELLTVKENHEKDVKVLNRKIRLLEAELDGLKARKDEKNGDPKKQDKKDENKPAPAKKNTFPDIDEFIKKLPADLPKAQVDMIRKNLEFAKKRFDDGQKRADDARKRAAQFQRLQPGRFGVVAENRLGVRLEKPSNVLIAQLGLAEGKGQVLAEVRDGSAAAKAGLKNNDILLELAGKDVSSDAAAFTKALDEIKKDTPIDAVILRQGKKETIKGITLSDAPPQKRKAQLQRRIK